MLVYQSANGFLKKHFTTHLLWKQRQCEAGAQLLAFAPRLLLKTMGSPNKHKKRKTLQEPGNEPPLYSRKGETSIYPNHQFLAFQLFVFFPVSDGIPTASFSMEHVNTSRRMGFMLPKKHEETNPSGLSIIFEYVEE